jgi:hypothetical protein
MGARRRVIYAAPSVSLEVSSALINVGERLGAEMVSVVLDVSEDVFRLGYGVVDALNMLHERNIAVRHAVAFVSHSLSSMMRALSSPFHHCWLMADGRGTTTRMPYAPPWTRLNGY